MTWRQFQTIAENIAKYVNREVNYSAWIPATEEWRRKTGVIVGIGVGANAGLLIIQNETGGRYAIFYERVNFPKETI